MHKSLTYGTSVPQGDPDGDVMSLLTHPFEDEEERTEVCLEEKEITKLNSFKTPYQEFTHVKGVKGRFKRERREYEKFGGVRE